MPLRSRRLARVGLRVGVVDRALSEAALLHPRHGVDAVAAGLGRAADRSMVWFAVAAVLMARRGPRRRAGMRGVLAVAGASGLVNGVLKRLLVRRRPGMSGLRSRRARPLTSSSFPSGHTASAAAFATAVAMEHRRAGIALAPVAAAVGWSRVHSGEHWTSDVLVGAGIGAGVALATRRWWPVRTVAEAHARPIGTVPSLPGGRGLLVVANSLSGPDDTDPAAEVAAALPHARFVGVTDGEDLTVALEAAVVEGGADVRALGVAGGDGTVAAVASVADRHRLPLVVVPAGTLNHFARDVGVDGLDDAVAAATAGEAVAVGLAVVEAHPSGRVHHFLNTASIGSYPELVRLREGWESRYGKWPAFAAALAVVLGRSERLWVRLDGRWQRVWFVFVGNGPYRPSGMVPAERPVLDSGLLDVRWLRADLRFSRLRVLGALLLGALGHSRVYREARVRTLEVELREPGALAADGEVVEESGHYSFRVATQPVPVYRRSQEQR